uniref:Uncharacterized protein n=1 Tax=Anguilla anguilla TaxID=7936 RepID=A0A0E9U993_ANGAN
MLYFKITSSLRKPSNVTKPGSAKDKLRQVDYGYTGAVGYLEGIKPMTNIPWPWIWEMSKPSFNLMITAPYWKSNTSLEWN